MAIPGFTAANVLHKKRGHFQMDRDSTMPPEMAPGWIVPAAEQSGEVIIIHGHPPTDEGPGRWWENLPPERPSTPPPGPPGPGRPPGGGSPPPPQVITTTTICTPCTAFDLQWCYDRICTGTGSSQSCVDGPLRQEACYHSGPTRGGLDWSQVLDSWHTTRQPDWSK